MASLPYLSSPGNIGKALEGIKTAPVPERVNQDFVKTILKIPGGSGDQMTAFLKKINFAGPDGKPTGLYTRYRNPAASKTAIADAIRFAYAPLYLRNEYMHELSDDKLLGLIVEETGQAHDTNAVRLTLSAIKSLKQHADFSAAEFDSDSNKKEVIKNPLKQDQREEGFRPTPVGLNLGYTININLPATSDQAVFNAIFKSIKENLLRDDDA